ncbi:MAG: DGQHR domain-containing protein, partial [Okeania sp. SIO2D1]|nr:DGQHR domain-containing protein [Okeania sp. SIO2D1]
MPSFEYVVPAIRGIQAGREYYISMFPLRIIPRLFPLSTEDVSPKRRSQRSLNRVRVPKIARYMLENPGDYTFSAITAAIDGEINFEALGEEGEQQRMGTLRIPMDAKFTITDGQHRRAAVEVALRENPDLGYETLAVVLYLDTGLQRSQQMFSDLNRYGVHPPTSLNILYDRRDQLALVTKEVVERVEVFRKLTELERSNIPRSSPKLFALSGIHQGNEALLRGIPWKQQVALGSSYW